MDTLLTPHRHTLLSSKAHILSSQNPRLIPIPKVMTSFMDDYQSESLILGHILSSSFTCASSLWREENIFNYFIHLFTECLSVNTRDVIMDLKDDKVFSNIRQIIWWRVKYADCQV